METIQNNPDLNLMPQPQTPLADEQYSVEEAYSGRYREPNHFDTEEFENLGGLHYMNYLHANDDML